MGFNGPPKMPTSKPPEEGESTAPNETLDSLKENLKGLKRSRQEIVGEIAKIDGDIGAYYRMQDRAARGFSLDTSDTNDRAAAQTENKDRKNRRNQLDQRRQEISERIADIETDIATIEGSL